ncbi:aminotransferase class V-fold PLP-dependent enzyme [Dyella silvatica]|uniref:aminotransferase class V-fold PLP-dependent enzyme n=1 Tax=Dyella silvatica TaxID=2992128 RepID=UPI00224C83D8|nr:aminotransferase class V-fold PLP-dependent enzyme [Dyella silvatica]
MEISPSPPLAPALFDFPPGRLWLSHCKDGPLPRASADAMAAILQTELRPWDLRWNEDFLDVLNALRESAAALLDVEAQDISLVTSTSSGLEAIALGFPWQVDDEVLIPMDEFPSNRLPWLALAQRGVRCREVELWPGQPAALPDGEIQPEQRLLDAIGPQTRLIAVSWIRYQDGVRLDLARLGRACQARGVHLVVDGIQGAGSMVPSLDGVSAFATGGHKGLLGLQGQGVLWTDRAFRQRLIPLGTWLAAPNTFSQSGQQAIDEDHWSTDGRRLEAGSPSIVGCCALNASLRLLLSVGGAARIEQHIRVLQRRLLSQLQAMPGWMAESKRLTALLDAQRLGPILSFYRAPEVLDALLSRGEAQSISASMRHSFLRIAFHGWHTAADADRTAQWLGSTAA